MRRIRIQIALTAILCFAITGLALLAGHLTGTTTAEARVPLYDASTVAHVEDRALATAETGSALANGVRDEPVSPPADRSGPSTTSSVAFVATEAAGSSIDDVLRPGGDLLGKAGSNAAIREVSGGLSEAQATFSQLTQGGTVVQTRRIPARLSAFQTEARSAFVP
jgi:hypothetical protein